MKQFSQDNPSITEGNHIWKGAAPIFKNKVMEIIELVAFSFIIFMFMIELRMTKVNNIDDAMAWIIKYFIAASVDNILSFDEINGIKASKLISKPIHVAGHELDLIEIIVPKIIMTRNNDFEGLNIEIKKKRIYTFINGV